MKRKRDKVEMTLKIGEEEKAFEKANSKERLLKKASWLGIDNDLPPAAFSGACRSTIHTAGSS